MIERLPFLWPEIALFAATCVVMVLGLSRTASLRKLTAPVAGIGVVIAGVLAATVTPSGESLRSLGAAGESAGQLLLPDMVGYAKCLIAVVGLMLLLTLGGTVDREDEAAIAAGRRTFDPLRSNRAEFYAFYLFSLTGLMLCAGASDLIWLFLALELTSLPTYIMVAISTPRIRGREAAVKYFFLGALGAAIFLYGFALIYGATGTTSLNEIHRVFMTGGINTLAMAGILLSLLGLCFKIAAVPMHFYTPDVYQGAAPQVSGFLAFVPKAAGFIAILLICATFGWSFAPAAGSMLETTMAASTGRELPEIVRITLWVVAALTMLVGNVLALVQTSVKRILAYSSIAHSGYMLVGVIAGPGDGSFTQNGLSAVLFYLLCYGVMNTGVFAVLAAIERRPGPDGIAREVEHVSDLRGLCGRHPVLGVCMVVCSLSLLGLPPLLGFFGKLPLFTSAIASDELPLVIWLGLNSAIAAVYYLRLAFAPLTEQSDPDAEPTVESPFRGRTLAAIVSAGGVITLAALGSLVIEPATRAGGYAPPIVLGAAPEVVPALPEQPAAAEVIGEVVGEPVADAAVSRAE